MLNIALVDVRNVGEPTKTYYEAFLYELLKERKPWQNISHISLPPYEEHVTHVRTSDHKDWFLIQDIDTRKLIGSIYLGVDNNIGIHIKEEFYRMGYGRVAIRTLMAHRPEVVRFKAHIAPNNSPSLCFFINLGFRYVRTDIGPDEDVTQFVYSILNPTYDEAAASGESSEPS